MASPPLLGILCRLASREADPVVAVLGEVDPVVAKKYGDKREVAGRSKAAMGGRIWCSDFGRGRQGWRGPPCACLFNSLLVAAIATVVVDPCNGGGASWIRW
jgi:hypothetical protein